MNILKIIINKLCTLFSKQNYSQKLDELEVVPVMFGLTNQNSTHIKLLNEASCDKTLTQKLLALKYRLEILPLKFHLRNFDIIRSLAKKWKDSQALFPIKELTRNDLRELRKVASHADFCEFIFKNEEERGNLFNWILRDQNDTIVFIQFPALIDKMKHYHLNGRLSCHGTHLLKIKKQKISKNVFQKIVTLPFEGRPINILDENQSICFRGNVCTTIAKVFEIFKNKDFQVGNFEFMKDGIINWNIHHLGYWDSNLHKHVKVDLEQEEWWRQLPYFEILNCKQVKARYGWEVDGLKWIAAASATRGSASLSYEQTHAFLEIAIPLGQGMYGVYDFGKLAYKYPNSFLETLDMFCKNVHATIAFPDENVFYSHRQHALHPFCLTMTQGLKLMDLIKKDIEIARGYNLIYQIESENCAKWVQLKLEAVLGVEQVPNLYRMQLLNTEPEGPVAKVFALIKKLPENWQVPFLTSLHLPLGASKKTWIKENGISVGKSLIEHPFFKTGEVYLPAFMHEQLLRGSLKCPLGMHDVYFAVGLLTDKHKFGFTQPTLKQLYLVKQTS